MTKEALTLALEALEECHQLIYGDETKGGVSDYMDGYYGSCFDFVSNKNQINEAITATKNVLAQPNFCPRCGKRLGTNDWDIHTCTPPQRKPLTDKELNLIGAQWHYNLLGKDDKAELFAFARAIEAAHGIGGEA